MSERREQAARSDHVIAALEARVREVEAEAAALRATLAKAESALSWAFAKMDRGDGVLEYTGTIAEGDEAVAILAAVRALLAPPSGDVFSG